MRYYQTLHVLFNFSDVLINLRMFDELKRKGGKVTAAMLSAGYFGDNQCASSSTKQINQTETRLPATVTTPIRDLANKEDPLTGLNSPRLIKSCAGTV